MGRLVGFARHEQDYYANLSRSARNRLLQRAIPKNGVCHECGKVCRCAERPSNELLVELLRKLAGLHPSGPPAWSNVHTVSDPPGFYSCSPALWDNAVKAIEDGVNQ